MSTPVHREPIYFRVLVFKQSGQWLAQCLERDLVAQAPSEQQAIDSFIRLLKLRLRRDYQNGAAPLVNLPPAPERYEEIWNQLIADDGEDLKNEIGVGRRHSGRVRDQPNRW